MVTRDLATKIEHTRVTQHLTSTRDIALERKELRRTTKGGGETHQRRSQLVVRASQLRTHSLSDKAFPMDMFYLLVVRVPN
ncbi:hypothetical protein CYMTET_10248 [Cymbomonas tetramitiformis]|uniref:Uncharacterized protein n=1 Tax=Cymbomonas tetramitiformis TaxID=36881 RepID=A0AAE0GQ38_9CHLO|nr:hypothetical protein CYMTET_10248 [Cymbomonas tetramitiformis]